MTAILRELRSLDERRARDEITDVEYLAKRANLIESVDVVEPEFVAGHAPEQSEASQPTGAMSWSFGLVICFGVVGVCLCLAMLTFADFNLALTLGVTVLAALSIALFRNLEE
ncbi:SHOCT domain-containing protein [Roseobacter sp.]|uniref:SHOCT domain-containing protein n=1 Tax=Roseobacter sp. TaxID=1907202 RepID=UPI00385BE369